MYDTARRVALVKQRVRENTRRRQRREAISLSASCMLLFAVLDAGGGRTYRSGADRRMGRSGAMLLREDAGGYVLVAVVSFAAAAAITALCFRLAQRKPEKRRGGQARPTRTGGEKPMKNEYSVSCYCLHGADAPRQRRLRQMQGNRIQLGTADCRHVHSERPTVYFGQGMENRSWRVSATENGASARGL